MLRASEMEAPLKKQATRAGEKSGRNSNLLKPLTPNESFLLFNLIYLWACSEEALVTKKTVCEIKYQ